MLGRDVGVDTLPIVAGQAPPQIARRALEAGRLGGYDVVLLDTAGRITLDEAMMAEAAEVKRAANPHEVLLVADALTGQDAVNLARSFDERVGLTGIVLTRVDGDGRGGAALSMRAVTGKPIKLIGTGEKMDALEDFDPARIAGRILGMGDIVSLVEKAAATIDAEKAMRTAERMRKGAFDLTDLREQLAQMQTMGGMSGLMGMLPGIGKMKNQMANANVDDKMLKRQMAIIDSMTPKERRNPESAQAQPQEAHRRRLRHQGRGHQQAPEDAPDHGRRDEGDGSGKRGPMAGIANMLGMGGGMPSPEQMAELAKKMPGGMPGRLPGMPPGGGCRRACPACRRSFPVGAVCPASAARSSRPASPAWGRRNEPIQPLRSSRGSPKASLKRRPLHRLTSSRLASLAPQDDGRGIQSLTLERNLHAPETPARPRRHQEAAVLSHRRCRLALARVTAASSSGSAISIR